MKFIYYWYSALGPVWAETRFQSGDWYGPGTLHPGQVLRGSLPLLSPDSMKYAVKKKSVDGNRICSPVFSGLGAVTLFQQYTSASLHFYTRLDISFFFPAAEPANNNTKSSCLHVELS